MSTKCTCCSKKSPAAVNLFHVLAVAPVLGYVSVQRLRGQAISKAWWYGLAGTALFVAVAHTVFAVQKLQK